MIENIEELINLSIPSGQNQSMWKCCVTSYQHGMVILKSKEDLNNHEILSFQHKMDDFFHTQIKLHGEEGATNYLHMLGSSHLMQYLLHWQNLHDHSQQGWEG